MFRNYESPVFATYELLNDKLAKLKDADLLQTDNDQPRRGSRGSILSGKANVEPNPLSTTIPAHHLAQLSMCTSSDYVCLFGVFKTVCLYSTLFWVLIFQIFRSQTTAIQATNLPPRLNQTGIVKCVVALDRRWAPIILDKRLKTGHVPNIADTHFVLQIDYLQIRWLPSLNNGR